jgi:hypothetical protein
MLNILPKRIIIISPNNKVQNVKILYVYMLYESDENLKQEVLGRINRILYFHTTWNAKKTTPATTFR